MTDDTTWRDRNDASELAEKARELAAWLGNPELLDIADALEELGDTP